MNAEVLQDWLDGADPEVLPTELRLAYAELSGAIEIRPLGDGLLHQSFHVRTGDSDYVLQRVNEVFAPEIQDNIGRVTRQLAMCGVRSVTLLATVDGADSILIGEQGRWRLMPHLGGVSFKQIQSNGQAHSAGVLVGRFHAALSNFDEPLAPMGIPYRNTSVYLSALRTSLLSHRDHRLWEEVSPLGDQILEAFDELGPNVETPECVIHGDLKLQNLLFESADPPGRDLAFALVDMDTLMRAPLWIEWGDAWRSWCNRNEEDSETVRFSVPIFEASLRGFLEGLGRDLSDAERGSLVTAPERITLELCMRYAADALDEVYWGWDKSRFASRGDHNLARARGQWQVYRAACETRAERERILLTARR